MKLVPPSKMFGFIYDLLTGLRPCLVPNEAELAVLKVLRAKLNSQDDDKRELYFRRIYSALGDSSEYQPRGSMWKTWGYQHEDPRSDIRGGGLLCLANLEAFLTDPDYSAHAQRMCLVRSDRNEVRNGT